MESLDMLMIYFLGNMIFLKRSSNLCDLDAIKKVEWIERGKKAEILIVYGHLSLETFLNFSSLTFILWN